jgi:hypothetical protein
MVRTLPLLVASAALHGALGFMSPRLPARPLMAPAKSGRIQPVRMAATVEEYRAAHKVRNGGRDGKFGSPLTARGLVQDLLEVVDKGNCAPIMVRLAWHDSGTFDKSKASDPFPKVGGPGVVISRGLVMTDVGPWHLRGAAPTGPFALTRSLRMAPTPASARPLRSSSLSRSG